MPYSTIKLWLDALHDRMVKKSTRADLYLSRQAITLAGSFSPRH